MSVRLLLACASLFGLAACSQSSETTESDPRFPALRELPENLAVAADHHIHVQSRELLENATRLAALLPPEFQQSMDQLPVIDAAAIIAELDAANIDHAAVLSGAYIMDMAEARDSWPEATRIALVQAENNFAAAEVSRYPERLRLFCGVNPLSDFSLDEITRCRDELGATGLKLHFASADVDLRDTAHLAQLAAFLRHAADLGLPVQVHMANRAADFGPRDVDNFIDHVVADIPELDLYLLHMAGWGSADLNQHSALQVWIDALNGGRLSGRENIYFEISVSYTRRQGNERLAEQIEAIGADRVLFGSDWPAFLRPAYASANFWTHVPLEESVIADILNNRAPYFDE